MNNCFKCRATQAHSICDSCVRKYAIKLSPSSVETVRSFIKEDDITRTNIGLPKQNFFYLFWNGQVKGKEQMDKEMFSRAAQLVSIARDGIPIVIGRRYMEVMYG